ncbi:type II toxin-antitoxin system RelE/ParE family toxin [Methylobacterium sp. J-088]|uniref:type II toxin-antitoxin system RelE/ParE family toxin n=1 Tax=Methylobacterium sp. J-088 TaxID=2836664 RepID=UPI001FB87799|nr:type II toxin-antitoxin system RelE/ParE family toxin [Methylobacterium sp. J-088]MCJ2065607.1 type II toxin-antitoxin system RelE/ParE family toxin [Methylobacterium sp. J-088]
MVRSVFFHPLARADLFSLYDFIEQQSGPERAGAYLDRIRRLCMSLADLPERTVPRDDLVPGLRTVALERRLLVALTVTDTVVTILRVLYAGCDLSAQDVPL